MSTNRKEIGMGDKLIMSKKERERKSMLSLVKMGQITQVEASRRLGLSYRQTKRIYLSYVKQGDEGLIHKSRGKPSALAYSKEKKEAVLSLYEQKYMDFGPTLAAEKLEEDDGYSLSAETLRLWLKEAGYWQEKRKRRAHRTRRARRPKFGELLQLDGSIHCWFVGIEEKQCLMNLVDDATGKTLALLDGGETTDAAFRLLKWWIKLHGIPMAIYVDLKSLYISPKSLRMREEDELVEPEWLTHFSRACKELGIEVIKAYSPQAKGRVERSHGVYQDRFVKELKLKGVTTIEGANKLLHGGFIDKLNQKFMKAPPNEADGHIGLRDGQNLDDLLCWSYTRVVQNDWVIRFENVYYQIQKADSRHVKPKQDVTVKRHLNGKITLWSKGRKLGYQIIIERPEKAVKKAKDSYERSAIGRKGGLSSTKSPWRQYNAGWLKRTQDYPEAIEAPGR